MLRIDQRRDPARALRLGDDVLHDGRLAGALGTVDLDDAPARDAADTKGDV
jgi:hypothetical protein